LKKLLLSKDATKRLSHGKHDFYLRDFEGSVRSFQPGEWVEVEGTNESFHGFVNSFVTSGPNLRIVGKKGSLSDPLEILLAKIQFCYDHRKQFIGYDNYRLCFGEADGLPGLIIDTFENCILMQINTAGIDKFREQIKSYLKNLYKEKEICFFDNPKYREREVLPEFESDLINDVKVFENNFKYTISKETIQKIGYYFDHRENRKKLEDFLKRFPTLTRGMDLFSYVGSWGLHLLRGGVEKVEFVDQANMESNTNSALEENGFLGRGQFIRKDVFAHLDLCIQNHERFDIIVSDPPAFSKSGKNLGKALGGYEKLHHKSLQLLNDKGLYVAASCTHGVSLEDLDQTVNKAAKRLNKNIMLLDTGVQGWDHPFKSFKSNSFYIKYLLYQVYE